MKKASRSSKPRAESEASGSGSEAPAQRPLRAGVPPPLGLRIVEETHGEQVTVLTVESCSCSLCLRQIQDYLSRGQQPADQLALFVLTDRGLVKYTVE